MTDNPYGDPGFTELTPCTITDEWVRGHIPRSPNLPNPGDYSVFRNGRFRGVPVGHILEPGPMAPLADDLDAAVGFYRQTDRLRDWAADVAVGDDEHGIWYSGELRPWFAHKLDGALPAVDGLRVAGDWRVYGGRLALIQLAFTTTGVVQL